MFANLGAGWLFCHRVCMFSASLLSQLLHIFSIPWNNGDGKAKQEGGIRSYGVNLQRTFVVHFLRDPTCTCTVQQYKVLHVYRQLSPENLCAVTHTVSNAHAFHGRHTLHAN